MSKPFDGFMAGVNLGGWLSQCPYRPKHYDAFLSEADFEKIARWGCDHVRLPFDYPLLEEDDAPGIYQEQGWRYLDSAVAWAGRHGLNIVLDLHRAPGFSFATPEANTLFENRGMQARFLALWRAVAARYAGNPAVAFELLNEIVEPDSSRWNRLAAETIAAIRLISPNTKIIVGGNHYNSPGELKNIAEFKDENIVYNFHFYDPFYLTHQRAGWNPEMRACGKTLYYPAPAAEYRAVDHFLGRFCTSFDRIETVDARFVEELMRPAFEFAAACGKTLYCGEFGVIDCAPLSAREAWHEDVCALFAAHGIGHAVWSYKNMNFTMIDENGDIVSERLLRAITRKV